MRLGLVSLLSSLLLACAAVPASATVTSSMAAGALTVSSDGADDPIVVSCVANQLLINGATPGIGAKPCTGAGAPNTVNLLGNGGADNLDVNGLLGVPTSTVTLDGGDGNDSLRGVPLTSNGQVVTLLGGTGDDLLSSNSSDKVLGGSGDDRLDGFVQEAGTLAGEAGTDTFALDLSALAPAAIDFTPKDAGMTLSIPGSPTSQTVPWSSIEIVDLVLNDAAQTVDARGFSGSLRAQTRDGADTIYGTEAGDQLDGGAGNDVIEGLGGADLYQGGRGLDQIRARDGIADSGDCGADDDTLVADAIDTLVNCERLDLPAVAVPNDSTKPKLKLKRATLGAEKLRLAVSCPATEVRCAGTLALVASGRRAGDVVRVKLGRITFTVRGGKTKTLVRAIPERKRDALRGLAQARLQVKFDVLDAAGNRSRGRGALPLG